MRKNSISALTIINPEDESISFDPSKLSTLAIGVALGVAGLSIIMQLKKSMQSSTAATTSAVGTDPPVAPGLLALAIAGVAAVAVWSLWKSYTNPRFREEDLHRNPKVSTKTTKHGYFVLVSGTSTTYPKPGSDSYPDGYSLKKAQDFARIGSQTGAPRKVLRGSPRGVVVRKYVDGKRVWPKTQAQASSLRLAERPSKLRKSA